MYFVRQRDKHVCQSCKLDIKATMSLREEYDHIIPFSEGGLTVLENMRTLCSPCHNQRTREWKKAKRAEKFS